MSQELALRFSGENNEMVNLTDMWKKSGLGQDYGPRQWRRKEGHDFINHVSEIKNVPVSHVFETRRGRGGGSWAHWQIGLAYAKYLSPEMHMKVNELVKQYVTADPELTKDLIDRTEDTEALQEFKDRSEERINAIETAKSLQQAIGQHVSISRFGYPICKVHDRLNKLATGQDTKTVRASRGLKKGDLTRDSYSDEELSQIAFAQNITSKALDKFQPKRGKDVVALADTIAEDCEALVKRYT